MRQEPGQQVGTGEGDRAKYPDILTQFMILVYWRVDPHFVALWFHLIIKRQGGEGGGLPTCDILTQFMILMKWTVDTHLMALLFGLFIQ